MSEQVRYVVNEQGERIGVLLDLEAYRRLSSQEFSDPERLVAVSAEELQALASSRLAPDAQTLLDELLERHAVAGLSDEETALLDRLLAQVDQLTLLKTRARYTLNLDHAPPP